MTTKEKLEAMDQNYDRHTQEILLGIIFFGTVSLVLAVIATGNPAAIKNVR